VAFASPLFLFAPLFRRWHLRWGATDVEVSEAMPGDELVSEPSFNATRAITIDAPPEAVWPWLVQIGYGRAGWYSYDLLDNGARPSAERILPEFPGAEGGRLGADGESGERDDRVQDQALRAEPVDAVGEASQHMGLEVGTARRRTNAPDLACQGSLFLASCAWQRSAFPGSVRVRRLPDDAQALPERETARRATGQQ
jgi:hypothetical protein